MSVTLLVTAALGALVAVSSAARWLRVAQREHYIAPWVTRIAWLWLRVRPLNALLALAVLALAVLSLLPGLDWFAALAVVPLAVLPLGLPLRGRTSPFAWTVRSRRLLAGWIVAMLLAATGLVVWCGPAGIALALLAAPLLTDLALLALAPIEKALSRTFLVSARKRLSLVRPKVVAITGSYGKTSTKGYVAHLLADAYSVVASPASFNNLMGLSRAVNERVVPGTEVFVAEMGVYGRGEIRELSASFPPDIAAITTIGEAHLARMGSRAVIFQAKAEITERAPVVVLPIDEPELAGLAETCRAQGKRVVTVSVTGKPADVSVDATAGTVTVVENGGSVSAPVSLPGVAHAVNLAVAVGIAVALGLPLSSFSSRLAELPEAQHRAEVQHAPSGVVIIDDTYNSNPVGAENAVRAAAALADSRGGPLVVVTPGMVELGRVQRSRNAEFATTIASLGGRLFAVARTNRAALLAGASGGVHPVVLFERRPQAVAAALDQAGDRGVILYENDLPDHYP